MKRANKHVKEKANPVQQSAFITPAQELQEFKAKVLALKHGPIIWPCLSMEESDDDPRRFSEWTAMVLAPFPGLFRRYSPHTPIDRYRARALADGLLRRAMREVGSKVTELWPQYKHLLKRNPDELKAYRDRYNQNRLPPDFAVRPRELPQERGRPQTRAERDAQIVHMKDVQKYTFGRIARKLGVGREVAESAYYRMKRHAPPR